MNTIINSAKTIAILIAIAIVNIFYWLPPIMIAITVATRPMEKNEILILLIGIPIELLIGIIGVIHARNITKER